MSEIAMQAAIKLPHGWAQEPTTDGLLLFQYEDAEIKLVSITVPEQKNIAGDVLFTNTDSLQCYFVLASRKIFTLPADFAELTQHFIQETLISIYHDREMKNLLLNLRLLHTTNLCKTLSIGSMDKLT